MKVSDPAVPPGTPFKIIVWKFIVDKSTIVENNPQEFAWDGVLIAKWFQEGRHHFKFEPLEGENGDVKCKLVQYEDFSGFLSIFTFLYGPILKRGFKQMNRALKFRAEAEAAAGEG